MTEYDHKLLTEYLDECWHKVDTEFNAEEDGFMWSKCICGDKWSDHSIDKRHRNRAFTTIQDFYDLIQKIIENCEESEFLAYAKKEWGNDPIGCFPFWLIHPDRCQTVASWLRGGEE